MKYQLVEIKYNSDLAAWGIIEKVSPDRYKFIYIRDGIREYNYRTDKKISSSLWHYKEFNHSGTWQIVDSLGTKMVDYLLS